MTQLEQLKQYTVIVADTGNFEAIKQYAPRDATTNPSLILKAIQMDEYKPMLDRVITEINSMHLDQESAVHAVMDRLLIAFGTEILKIVPGRVSTEVDARLSFDTAATIAKAHDLIALYAKQGMDKERILIKVASTWEGIQAAKALTQEGIHCNMTLLFSLPQAVAAAQVNAQLISPFVGRIYDWYKAKNSREYVGADDPGVQSVRLIYDYYKKFEYKTEVMGASFRNIGEIRELAGCDLLTISPQLLGELSASTELLDRKLSADAAKQTKLEPITIDEKSFRWMLNEDAMATEKLSEGIRVFTADAAKLETIIAAKLA